MLAPGDCILFSGREYMLVSDPEAPRVRIVPLEFNSLTPNNTVEAYLPKNKCGKALVPEEHLRELIDRLRKVWQPCWVTGTCPV